MLLPLQFFLRQCQKALAERATAEAGSLEALPLQQRLHTLLRWRLEMLLPHIGTQLGLFERSQSSNSLFGELGNAAGC